MCIVTIILRYMNDNFNGPSIFVRIFPAHLNHIFVVLSLELILKLRQGYFDDLALSILPSKLSRCPDFIHGRLRDSLYLRCVAKAS